MDKENKTKKEDSTDLDPEKKPVREPEFAIHKMPKGYKTGRFDSVFSHKNENGSGKTDSSSFSVLAEKKDQEKKHHSRKAGLFVVFFGLVVVVFLIYFVVFYIKNPNGISFKMPSFNTSLNKKVDINNSIIPENKTEENGPEMIEASDLLDINDTENNFEEIDQIDNTEDIPGDNLDQDIIADDTTDNTDNVPMIDSFSDTDTDGLSDDEETLLGSNLINIDTDSDGYDDLTELINLYNPTNQGSISDNQNISKYNNSYFSYDILHPSAWELKSLNDGSSAIFLINDASFVQVLAEKNEGGKNIKDWYFSRFFEIVEESSVVDNSNWQGVYSPDFYSFYLTDKNREYVYSIVYSFPENVTPNYYNIFRMMINSFNLK
ncbi:hypothetical protein CVU82_04420 [Candidatus Falkowbacteria bacterium HGW-Falkowbacteria-1]|jgi:hypothetical protein|uniref:Uncharacterized protein n=1 Tax=Candidatus Falkowbacteria bacterium HGW-Falkowbacteria-1 TaxID=2013768 RepID=A0A2N2E8E2_9BACT|nr:MAG: hypothetical protein CVU82_04420 [Candidatus Falkowbacteria bacterium HGW-Falkowbacteria-1]